MNNRSKLLLSLLGLMVVGYLTVDGKIGGWRGPLGKSDNFIKMGDAGGGLIQAQAPSSQPTVSPTEAAPTPTVAPIVLETAPVKGTPNPNRRAKRRSLIAKSTAPVVDSTPANKEKVTAPVDPADSWNQEVSIGIDTSTHFLFPTLRYRVALMDYLALGVFASGMHTLAGDDISVAGGGFNATYFIQGTRFRGWFVDAEVGYYDIQLTNFFRSSRTYPVTFASSVGWRAAIGRNITYGVSAGFLNAFNGQRNIQDIYFDGLLPLLKLGIAVDF